MALIEIDGLPIKSMVIFHGELLNNQRVYGKSFKQKELEQNIKNHSSHR